MADIRKQALTTLPMKQETTIVIIYGKKWYVPVKKILGKKEVVRYVFNIIENGEEKLFECNIKLAALIIGNINRKIFNEKIDVNYLKEIEIHILKDNKGYKVNSNIINAKKIGIFKRIFYKFINRGLE